MVESIVYELILIVNFKRCSNDELILTKAPFKWLCLSSETVFSRHPRLKDQRFEPIAPGKETSRKEKRKKNLLALAENSKQDSSGIQSLVVFTIIS